MEARDNRFPLFFLQQQTCVVHEALPRGRLSSRYPEHVHCLIDCELQQWVTQVQKSAFAEGVWHQKVLPCLVPGSRSPPGRWREILDWRTIRNWLRLFPGTSARGLLWGEKLIIVFWSSSDLLKKPMFLQGKQIEAHSNAWSIVWRKERGLSDWGRWDRKSVHLHENNPAHGPVPWWS